MKYSSHANNKQLQWLGLLTMKNEAQIADDMLMPMVQYQTFKYQNQLNRALFYDEIKTKHEYTNYQNSKIFMKNIIKITTQNNLIS